MTDSSSHRSLFPELLAFAQRPASHDLRALQAKPAVCLLADEESRPILLLTTQDLRRTANSRLAEDVERPSGRADLAQVVRQIWSREVGSPFEARWWYYRAARQLYPRRYRKLISFGPSWFLHVDWSAGMPEIRVTEKVWAQEGQFLGPFPSQRAATQAQEGLWDLFDLCRYPEQLRKTPHGVKCAYAEMGRCDAPCDGSAPPRPYAERTQRAWRFACGGAAQWMDATRAEMKRAAVQQEFERAGLLKKQLEFAEKWEREYRHVVRPAEALSFAILVPVTRRKLWTPFYFHHGQMVAGDPLPERGLPKAAAEWFMTQSRQMHRGGDNRVRMEQTWLLGHLLYSRERERVLLRQLPDGVPRGDFADWVAHELEQRANREEPDDTAAFPETVEQ